MEVANTQSSTDQNLLKALGEAVMTRRIQLNVTQDGLCKQSGLTRSLVARLESGLLDVDIFTLYKLSCALEISVADLLELAQPA